MNVSFQYLLVMDVTFMFEVLSKLPTLSIFYISLNCRDQRKLVKVKYDFFLIYKIDCIYRNIKMRYVYNIINK
jgi:hypothetical protein